MKYFTLDELTYSTVAKNLGIDNSIKDQIIIDNLNTLVDNVLDPLRHIYGRPITVSSGYRCNKLNTAMGGAKNSQHKQGCAADIVTAKGVEGLEILMGICLRDLEFDQLIWENTWIHVSFKENANRHQVLIYLGNGKYQTMGSTKQAYYVAIANKKCPKLPADFKCNLK